MVFGLTIISISGIIILVRKKKRNYDKNQRLLCKINNKNYKNEKQLIKKKNVSPLTKLKQRIVFRNLFECIDNLDNGTITVRVSKKIVFTPKNYDRYIFHLELTFKNKMELNYLPGDCISIYSKNDLEKVKELIEKLNVNADEVIIIPESTYERYMTVYHLFYNYLDIFGKPSRKFYYNLSKFAKSKYERLKLAHIGSDDRETFKVNNKKFKTYADILLDYKSLDYKIDDLIEIIPKIKPRHYSIASSNKINLDSVHILVSVVEWKTHEGETRYGQCSGYLSKLEVGDRLIIEKKITNMRLPQNPALPIIMAGLGTGMAPFRAFIQEKLYEKKMGENIGDIELFFGARYREKEYLYGNELDIYKEFGNFLVLNLAFSRDQKNKVYIQHKMEEKNKLLYHLLMEKGGYFYLCGPTWPVPEIKKVLEKSGIDIEKLRSDGRYILEVY